MTATIAENGRLNRYGCNMPRHRSPPVGHGEAAQADLDLRQAFGDTPHIADRQTPIIAAGEPCRQVILVASGWACRERLLAEDRRAILDLYLPGDLIGLDHLFLERTPDCIVALTAVSYHALEWEALERLLQNRPDLALALSHQRSKGWFEAQAA